MLTNLAARSKGETMKKTFNNTHIVVVDHDSVQLFDGKIIRYDFVKDKQASMYEFFKNLQEDAKLGSKYDIDKFNLHIKNDTIYVIHSPYYEIKSEKIKEKGKFGFSLKK